MITNQNKSILDPYKTIGYFVNGPISSSESLPYTLAVACHNSFKIYSHELSIKVVSPCFQQPITSIATYNEYTYVRSGKKLIKMKYHHVVDEWQIDPENETHARQEKMRSSMLRFDDIMLIGEDKSIFVVDQQSGQINRIQITFKMLGIVHPIGYINKVIAYGKKSMFLVNVINETIVYEFPNLSQFLTETQQTICLIEPTKSIHFVAICTSSGKILIYNIKSDKLMLNMKQKNPVSALAFSSDHPYMATADSTGKILLWDYENGKIMYKFQQALNGSIQFIWFVPGYPLITCASTQSNQIRQFRINQQQNKILTLFRQRSGINQQIEGITIHNDKQITFKAKNETFFSSLYSHCNNYIIKNQLCSRLPYHISKHNFSVNIHKNQTIMATINIHENPSKAQISLSCKYAIVVTKSKMIKLSIPAEQAKKNSCSVMVEWKLPNIQHIVLYHEHFIYAFCQKVIYIYDFNTTTLIGTINQGKVCRNPSPNLYGNLLAIENQTDSQLEIWDMEKRERGRIFSTESQTLCLAFTSDNRFLLSSHANKEILVWNIVDNELYKQIQIFQTIKSMGFTPDNNYFLCVFEGQKQVNIWQNYIGKITTNRNKEIISEFRTQIKKMEADYRVTLSTYKQQIKEENPEKFDFQDLLNQIQDSKDDLCDYKFKDINKWMPLVYYDQIKARNTIQAQETSTNSIPFFLDFSNIDQEKKKMVSQIQAQIQEKKKQDQEKRDKLLKNDQHQITLNEHSTEIEFMNTFNLLSSLSIAEVDYQLRRFMLLPENCVWLGQMFIALKKQMIKQQEVYNIILIRYLDLLGSQICSEQLKKVTGILLERIERQSQCQSDILQHCLAIIDNKK